MRLWNVEITVQEGKKFERSRVMIEPPDWGPPKNHKQTLTIIEENGTRTEFPVGSFKHFHWTAVPS